MLKHYFRLSIIIVLTSAACILANPMPEDPNYIYGVVGELLLTDDAELTLKIISAVSEPEGEDWNINPDTFIGLLWVIFITLCVCVALIDKVQEISTKRRGG